MTHEMTHAEYAKCAEQILTKMDEPGIELGAKGRAYQNDSGTAVLVVLPTLSGEWGAMISVDGADAMLLRSEVEMTFEEFMRWIKARLRGGVLENQEMARILIDREARKK